MTKGREAKHYVSLLAVTEVHSLALLTRVLAALRANNNRDIPEVKWDSASLAEYVDFWLTNRRILRERLLPIGAREADWKGMKARREGCENVLEEKVVAELEAVGDVLGEAA
jgi:nuclear pore complex protein Nup188